MGLRDKIKGKIKETINRFSGEYSAADDGKFQEFERNLPPDPNAKVVRANLNRPPGSKDHEG